MFSHSAYSLIIALLVLMLPAPALSTQAQADPPALANASETTLWYFWREHCPHCDRASDWLDDLQQRRPELVLQRHDVIGSPEGQQLFFQMMKERGEIARAVPAFIVDKHVWVGFSGQIAAEIEAYLEQLQPPAAASIVQLGPLGFSPADHSLLGATLLIAFVDGFNPCSLWVLTVLLAMILGSRSRARIAIVGVTFLLVTGSIYGLFIVGLFSAFMVAGQLGWIQIAVATLALLVGLINIKDFYAYKRGLSLTIPDRFKPAIYRRGRALRSERSLTALILMTIAMAAGVAMIELPCTAGFPIVWSNIIADAGVSRGEFASLLIVYLAMYLSVEMAILTIAIVTLRPSRMQESHGRSLKLFGGCIMLAIGMTLLTFPELMETLSGSLLVIGFAAACSAGLLLAHRAGITRPAGNETGKKNRLDTSE